MNNQDGFMDLTVFDEAGEGAAGTAGAGSVDGAAGVGVRAASTSVQSAAQGTASAPATPANVTFKEGIGELEEIIRELEGGQLELEDSLLKYERGVGLLRALQSKISDAEQKVTVLLGEIEPESSDAIDEQLS